MITNYLRMLLEVAIKQYYIVVNLAILLVKRVIVLAEFNLNVLRIILILEVLSVQRLKARKQPKDSVISPLLLKRDYS